MPHRYLLQQMPLAQWIMAADLALRSSLDQRTLDHHVHTLIKDGVAIGCCKRRGYCLLEAIDFIDQGELIDILKASPLLRPARLCNRISNGRARAPWKALARCALPKRHVVTGVAMERFF